MRDYIPRAYGPLATGFMLNTPYCALLPGEIVHHKDEIKRNNHPDNLEVFASQAEHARHHRLGRGT